jgi:hypothetical protein
MIVCKECKSENIQTVYWVRINSQEIVEMALSETQDKQDNWCPDCEEHCELVLVPTLNDIKESDNLEYSEL